MRPERDSNAKSTNNSADTPAIHHLTLAPYCYQTDKSSCRYAYKLYFFFYSSGRAILKEGVESYNTPLIAAERLHALQQPNNNYAATPTV